MTTITTLHRQESRADEVFWPNGQTYVSAPAGEPTCSPLQEPREPLNSLHCV